MQFIQKFQYIDKKAFEKFLDFGIFFCKLKKHKEKKENEIKTII